MDCPRIARLTDNADLRALYVAADLGIVPDTASFPAQADFRFSLCWHDPEWGFRAATAKYYQRHPQFFARRLKQGGIWNAFGPIQKVKGWQDFGFAYDEHSETPLQFDNDNHIASFAYIEPMTYWLPMAKGYPRTNEGALQALKDNLEKGDAAQKQWAQVTLSLAPKPYSPLLNTRFAELPDTFMADYFHRSAVWGIFPSFFNGDTFVDGKWITTRFFDIPELCERVRPLYKQFIPILRHLHEAGWEPITYARTDAPAVQIERYGPGPGREMLLAVFNGGKSAVEAKLTLAAAALKLAPSLKAALLVNPKPLAIATLGTDLVLTVAVEPGRCEVLRLGE
jgi:hypothetical protein